VIIPKDPIERQQLYEDLVRQCFASRFQRFDTYQTLRNFYLFGSADSKGAPYNKIFESVDTLSSFIYSPDSARFSIHLGTTHVKEDVYKAEALGKEVADQWRMSKTNLRFGLGVKWALVYGCMIVKARWERTGARTHLVEPHQFGVLREDVIELEDQEAFAMAYSITESELERTLEGNPRQASIMKRVREGGGGSETLTFSEGLTRLVLGGPVGGVTGSVALGATSGAGGAIDGGMGNQRGAYDYVPRVEAPLVNMIELYVWNDEEHDYQMVTIASPNIVIYDRIQVGGVQGAPNFEIIRPEENLYDYFWGDSYVARLCWLQDWRTERTLGIRRMENLEADPPMVGTGLGGISEEKMTALRGPGGRLAMAAPTGKIDVLHPQVPEDLYKSIDRIDQMFDGMAGIGHVLQGKGESGVRSRGQADLMARIGSARPKERALSVEESAAGLATLMLRLVQDHSPQRFQVAIPGKPEPLTFIAEQFTKDYEVKVDAHSASPIFVEDRKKDAEELHKMGVIDGDTVLEMFDPPNVQQLKAKFEVIKKERAAQAQQQAAAGASHGGHHGKAK